MKLRRDLAGCKIALVVASMACAAGLPACAPASTDATEDEEQDTSSEEGSSKASEDGDKTKPSEKKDAGTNSSKTEGSGGSTAPAKDAGKPTSGSTTSPAKGTDAPAGGGTSSSSLYCKAKAVIDSACLDCHNEELVGGAPMSLVKLEDFLADAPVTSGKKVYEVVKTRVHDTKKPMPPQRKLTADELAAIDAWADSGAKGTEGECGATAAKPADDLPWPPVGAENCYKLTVPGTTVKAGSEPHPQFKFDAPWGDTKVHALGFRPITDNKKVLHHWILYSQGGGGGFLSGWAPGQDAAEKKPLPAEVGIAMPSGKQSMRLDMHYFNLQGTSDEKDSSGVEVCVTSQLRKYSAGTYMGFVGIPVLPAGQKTDTVGNCTVSSKEPVYILSESPHAHELAYWMKFEIKRGGETITLRDESFNFNEQVARALPEPFELKNGDQIVTTCRFDNTTGKTVTFGENTGNEMCFNFAVLYPLGALSCGGGLGGFGL